MQSESSANATGAEAPIIWQFHNRNDLSIPYLSLTNAS